MSDPSRTAPQVRIFDKNSPDRKPGDPKILARDGYAVNPETDAAGFPVEPLNTFSNFIFLIVIVYWIRKTRFKTSLFPVLVLSLPFMFVAFICGTMHHALRSDKVWHHLNMLSIFYAVIMVCVYFWYRITGSWIKSFFCVIIIPLIFRFFLASITIPGKISVSVVFVVMALAIFIPATIQCIINKLKYVSLLIFSSTTFVIALYFRETDWNLTSFLSHGTHFLWHIFGAVSVFSLLQYIYLIDRDKNLELFKQAASRFKTK